MKIKKIGIVSLSSGILGENFVAHELKLGLQRLQSYDIDVEFLPHARKGLSFLNEHPECRAQDLLAAFSDPSLDMILCAIGGDDTYKLTPYLFENKALENAIKESKDKVFLGFSDTTVNHFMLHKCGLVSHYGQAFLPDVCELSENMLPYSKQYLEELLLTGRIAEVRPSDVWYQEREDFSEKSLGLDMPSYPNQGFILLQGAPQFQGKILGGCLESLYYTFLSPTRHSDSLKITQKYELFPKLADWKGKILLLETSEKKSEPALFRKMIQALQGYGLFSVLAGLLVGKPQNETYSTEYRQILREEVDNPHLPILYNLNIGHATPRCILPFGVEASVDAMAQCIKFHYEKQ